MRPPRIATALTIVAAAFHWSLNLGERTLFTLPWLGALLGLAGFILMMWAWWLFRQRAIAVCPTARTTSLVTHGPYRFTRNPMYLGMVLMMSGLSLYIGTLPFYLSAIGYFAIMNFFFCPYEENKLANAFGREFTQYRTRVRRWL
jgi:protein-S-isoprenylcysteine O-methyltransferase Ste14